MTLLLTLRKTVCLATLLVGAVLPARANNVTHASPTPSAATDIGWDLALDRSIPGKGGWTTCYTYATGLQKKFTQAGGESHVVIYNWMQAESGVKGCHAFLVYRDAAGQYWGIDAVADRPRWLRGTSPPEWATFWDTDKNVQVIADLTDRKLKGRWANAPKV